MKAKISKKMKFSEILNKYPETMEVFLNEGMHCFGCVMAGGETIEQGALAHGLNPDDIIKKLEKQIKKNKK